MSWYYRPFKILTDVGSYYVIKEFFNTPSGKGWTKDAICPTGDNLKDLIKTLELMLKDSKTRKPKIEDKRTKK